MKKSIAKLKGTIIHYSLQEQRGVKQAEDKRKTNEVKLIHVVQLKHRINLGVTKNNTDNRLKKKK